MPIGLENPFWGHPVGMAKTSVSGVQCGFLTRIVFQCILLPGRFPWIIFVAVRVCHWSVFWVKCAMKFGKHVPSSFVFSNSLNIAFTLLRGPKKGSKLKYMKKYIAEPWTFLDWS